MFRKKEGYVTKANRQMVAGKVPESYRTLIDGLDDYQKRIVAALCPYPVSDAALLVVALRTMADSICENNQSCLGLVEEINQRFVFPKFEHKEKREVTKKR